MSKFIFVVCAIFLLFAAVYPQQESDLEKSQLRGKVKSIEAYRVSFDAEKGWANRQLWLTESYNTDGNIIERAVFQDGKISSKTVSFYDARGRQIGNDSYSAALDKTMSAPSKTVLVLDDSGHTVELKVYAMKSPETVDVLHKFKYDSKGNQIERDYGRSGKSVVSFDAGNNETSVTHYNGEGRIYGKTFTEYDAQNRRIKLIIHRDGMFYHDARLRYEISYVYDERGRIIEQITKEFNVEPNVTTSHAPEPGRIVYKYDEARHGKEKSVFTSDGYLKEKSVILSDERGNEIGFDCSDFTLQTCRRVVEYQYDNQGNWISKTSQSRSGAGQPLQPNFREERIFNYY